MKISDKKQREKAWRYYYESFKRLLESLDFLIDLEDRDLTVDEINQLAMRVDKFATTVERIIDSHNMHKEK
jgi:nucleoside-triphosphatase THEP1